MSQDLKKKSFQLVNQQQRVVYKKPSANRFIMSLSTLVTHQLHFKGVPLLRSVPFLTKRYPWLKMLRMKTVEFTDIDLEIAQDSISAENCCIFAPNHVEVFTDFVMNWEIGRRLSSKMAFWAGADLVNGPLKGIWLRHNIIANTPGGGGKNYSLQNVLDGHGVLLHPEGKVAWTRDYQHKVYPGVATLAIDAVRKCKSEADYNHKKVIIQPMIYRYYFLEDATDALHQEIDLIAARLSYEIVENNKLSSHFSELCLAVFESIRHRYTLEEIVHKPSQHTFWKNQDALLHALLDKTENEWSVVLTNKAEQNIYDRIIRLEKKMRLKERKDKEFAQNIVHHEMRVEELWYLHRFSEQFYSEQMMSQEHIAECLQRIREMYFIGGTFDAVRKMIPLPVADRKVVAQMAKPIAVIPLVSDSRSESIKNILDAYKNAIREKLDEVIVSDIKNGRHTIINPFFVADS